MSESLRHLENEHRDIARLLTLLERQVQYATRRRPPDRGLLRDIMHYLTHYSDLFHHPREELIFARVGEYDPPLREVIASLSQEHRLLARRGTALYRGLSRPVDSTDLGQQLGHYAKLLRQHIDREEELVFARAEELLTDGDWAYVEAGMAQHTDPLFGSLMDKQYRVRYQHILRLL